MEPKKSPVSKEVALASQVFDLLCAATTQKTILGYHRHLCELLRLKPSAFPHFYPKLKSKLCSWRAKALWAKFDKRASHKCYNRGKACPNTKVLIIGAGPCGLRSAIEAQLLGAKVVVVEKRDRISRHNVLHLWPFVIHDLKALNAKKFFGKFCAGAIDHISIRQLQCILLKVALILGVEFHEGVGFESVLPPPDDQSVEKIGWRAKVTPADHPVSQYEFDVLIGADGKRNTLEGFKRKEFRGKLAIAITANFINRHTEAEARVEEISGVAFIFNQKFFKDLYAETGIDLENIVYYKDETHYFVMTAKKHSLISNGVILNDYPDTVKLLSAENKDQDALMKYARDAAEFSTNYIMQNLEFAVDHYGQPDVAMFDFTSMFAAENASRVVERNGYKLLQTLVGDSLLEPFWPTGSGCARGFLSSMDACWAMKAWGSGQANTLEVLAERESIYRILGQTTPENLQRDYAAYTLDPSTRYPNLNKQSVNPIQVKQLYDTDVPSNVELPQTVPTQDLPKKRRRKDSPPPPDYRSRQPSPDRSSPAHKLNFMMLRTNLENLVEANSSNGDAFCPKRRMTPPTRDNVTHRDSQVHPDTLLHWLKKQVALYDREVVHIDNVTSSFKNGLALCAILHRYRPDLIDFHALRPEDVAKNNQLAFDTLERELGVPPVMTGLEMEQCDIPDKLTMLSYLNQIYDTFRGEIPHIKHPKLEMEVKVEDPGLSMNAQLRNLKPEHKVSLLGRITGHMPRLTPSRKRVVLAVDREAAEGGTLRHSSVDKRGDTSLRRQRKRRSQDKVGATVEEQELSNRIEDIRQNRFERQMRKEYILKLTNQQFYKSMQMLQTNAKDDEDGFEDYSLFVYRQTAPNFGDRIREMERKILYPDREARIQEEIRKGSMNDENLSDKVKMIEDKLRGRGPATDKKPKDLCRAIGKIEKSDWNVKEIEKKIQENKMGRGKRQDRKEKVPKWSREQFDDKFEAMKSKLQRRSLDKDKDKYADIDVSLKRLDRKIKEGSVLDMGQRGSNKVSALAEQLAYKTNEPEKPAIQKSSSKAALVLPSQGGSEACHFCNKRVYLMERLSAESKFFHRGCFRCEYCSTTLRLGNYAFDRDGKHGSRFFCIQHFGQQTQPGGQKNKMRRKSDELRMELGKENVPSKKKASTPKIVEKVKSDKLDGVKVVVDLEEEESSEDDDHSEMDEDEWTDVNFGASAAEGSSDSASDISDSEEEPNEVFEDAVEPALAAETRRLAETWTKRYSGGAPEAPKNAQNEEEEDESDDSYEDDGSDDGSEGGSDYDTDEEESDTATEGEAEIRARALRKLEVPVEKRPTSNRSSDTGSDTEQVATDDYSSESESEEENSATEISTDSEFEHDGTTPTQHEIPSIRIDDSNITFRKRVQEEPKKVQVRTGHIVRPVNGTVGKPIPPPQQRPGVKLEFKSLRPENEPMKSSSLSNLTTGINNINNNNTKLTTVVVPTPLINPRRGDYLLNRTMSTEGIASKLSLELKKKYLLGPSGLSGSVKKSGSASTLDSTFKSVVDVISEQQKLLKPAAELSPSMQAFLQGTSQVRPYTSPLNPLAPSLPVTSLNHSTTTPLPPLKDLASEDPFEHVCALRNKDEVVRHKEVSGVDLEALGRSTAAPKVESTTQSTAIANGVSGVIHYKPIEEEADCRPRSPVHETSIVVPDIPWKVNGDDMESDSLSSEDSSSETEDDEDEEEGRNSKTPSPVVVKERTPPRVEIHNSSGEVIEGGELEDTKPDKLLPVIISKPTIIKPMKPTSIDLFNKRPNQQSSVISERSSPSSPPSTRGDGSESVNNEATLALTETEWSDWAHDGDAGVSEDLEDVEFNINPQFITHRRHKKMKTKRVPNTPARMAKCEDFNDFDDFPQHVCGKKDEKRPEDLPTMETSRPLSRSIDNIEFMDTGDEDDSGTDDFLAATNKTLLQNSGYVQFDNSDDEDIDTPIVETPKLPHLATPINVLLLSECGETSDSIDPLSLETYNKNLVVIYSGDDDESSFQPTTDDTTTSDLITVKDSPLDLDVSLGDPFYTPEDGSVPVVPVDDPSGSAYKDYVQRLQGRISPFSNVRDSIDIRKSRKPATKVSPQELISEEVYEVVDFRMPSPAPTMGISQKLEELSRDRSKQKDLVHEMVMGKISGQRRSQDRKAKRSITRSSMSPLPLPCISSDKVSNIKSNSPPQIASLPVIESCTPEPKSLPTLEMIERERRHSLTQDTKTPNCGEIDEYYTPLTSFKKNSDRANNRPLSFHSSFRGQRPGKYVGKPGLLPDTPLTNPEAFSCPDIHNILQKSPDDPFRTPLAPHQARHDEKRTVDREQARMRARLKSDAELGLSPEDYIKSLKEKVLNRPSSRNHIDPLRTIQITSDIFHKNTTTNPLFVDSDTAVVDQYENRSGPSSPASAPVYLTPFDLQQRKKSKDPERRKTGIIQAVSDFFHKKKDTPSPPMSPDKPAKDKFSRFKFTAKSREKGKHEKVSPGKDKVDSVTRRSKSLEDQLDRMLDPVAPPIPPPPHNYAGNAANTRLSEDSLSEAEEDSRLTAPSTPTHRGAGSTADPINSAKRHSRMNKRMARQVQLKRLRMAQEIQRQLEELEVKQRELERRGVSVEKALRGEGDEGEKQEEEELLREWFDLMREGSELRRYEHELMLRAEELQLEDRHARLQQELRDKMDRDDADKTSEDVVKEGQILAEMLDIVERKDSLVALLEEDRLRYQEEDRDIEAQMVAKGLRLTPLRQESHV